jgi:hypothetical protein
MSTIDTYSSARQKLAALLEQAIQEGEVKIRRKDGQIFVIKPESRSDSPLAVESLGLDITTPEIIEFIHEGRRKLAEQT